MPSWSIGAWRRTTIGTRWSSKTIQGLLDAYIQFARDPLVYHYVAIMPLHAPMSIDEVAPRAPVDIDGAVPMDHMIAYPQPRDLCFAIGMILRTVSSLEQYEIQSYLRISQARFMCVQPDPVIPHSGDLATPILSYAGDSRTAAMRGGSRTGYPR